MEDSGEVVQTENTQLISRAEHLKPHWWKPGQSGNPGGRPKKLTNHLERHLDEIDPETGKSYGDMLVEAAVQRAIRKSDVAMKEVWDRAEGPLARPEADSARPTFQVIVIKE